MATAGPLGRSIEAIVTMFLILVGTGFDQLWDVEATIVSGHNELPVVLGCWRVATLHESRVLFFVLMTVLLRFALGSRNHLTIEYGEGAGPATARTLLLDLAALMSFGLLLRLTASQPTLQKFFESLAVTFVVSAVWSLRAAWPLLRKGEIKSRANWAFWFPMDVLTAIGCLLASATLSPTGTWWAWLALAAAACGLAVWDVWAQLRALSAFEENRGARRPLTTPRRWRAIFFVRP